MNWTPTAIPCSSSAGDAATGSRRCTNSDIGIIQVIPISELVQRLDAVTAPSTKQKEDILFIWIQLEVEFHNGCQSINPAPQIRITCGNVNFPKAGCVIQHGGFLLSGRVILLRLNSRFPGRGSLSGLPDPDGKWMMHLVMQPEV